ncbi:MAG: homocysteine S-methyltransferase family protein [Lachnospiraceae bacterium]|nr:homocysteine S-methyltransferase family protein [Lachnospiraceae bacterium]
MLYLDGGMGTLLQERGLKPGELPERWNISRPDDIVDIHKMYYEAGSNVVLSNTFGANLIKYEEDELKAVIEAAINNAKRARDESVGDQEKYVALDIGSMGKLLKPYGDYEFEDAVKVYSKTVEIGAAAGADLIFIETMSDSYDTKAAVLAAKESCDLPVFASNAYGEDGKLMTGASPAAMVAMLEGLGVDALGANCSLGPKQLVGVVDELVKYASVPVILKPNAGLPRSVDGVTVYDVEEDEFSTDMAEFVNKGVRICGGCCGTTPAFIKETVDKTKDITPALLTDKGISMVSSYTHVVEFGRSPVLIGERINPTGKKKFKEALRNEDIDYILGEGLKQQEKGAHVLDVNVGIPEIDEPALLKRVCYELQAIINLPLQIDTTDVVAMEAALRQYNGKAMINSVNGKDEVMREIFPLVKKYGGLVVCLTLDEDGIPENADKRFEIAKHIIEVAAEYKIAKKDLIFDTLAMTVSADDNAALATLQSLNRIHNELKCLTSLGVSNVSFGLPLREVVTATFFTLAMENGLSAAIMNPNSGEMMKAYYSFRTLHGLDKNCQDYITNIEKYAVTSNAAVTNQTAKTDANKDAASDLSPLQHAIVKGLKEQASQIAKEMLESVDPLDIVNNQIIPALDIVGKGFEAKTMYLPQLLMSAEASQSAFEQIKAFNQANATESESRGKFIVATVKGDVHDIGKNIVKLILENYGFDVIDLGKDVAPELIVETAIKDHVPFVGLSALMTTTVPAMEETIKQLRVDAPWVKVCVGGAVLTQEYADEIGADFYGKDAMATVRFAVDNA